MYRSITLLVLCFVNISHSFSDVGKWDLSLGGESCLFTLAKSLFKDSKLKISFHCDVAVSTNITVVYRWEPSMCSPDYFHFFEKHIVDCYDRYQPGLNLNLNSLPSNNSLAIVYERQHKCNSKDMIILDDGRKAPLDSDEKTDPKKLEGEVAPQYNKEAIKPIVTVAREGVYMLRMQFYSNMKFNATVSIEMIAPSGYLSAAIWPLLPFFGIMCGVYTVLCTLWLIVCALNWRDLLRIQYWIGGVALLGMVESATYYGVYSSINHSGSLPILSESTVDLLRIQYWIGGVALLGMVESATYYGVYSSINHSGSVAYPVLDRRRCAPWHGRERHLLWGVFLHQPFWYWIGGVALLGMVESATYYGVYSSINHSGLFNAEAYMFAEWVSVAKRALARMLVIIVSLGFGIVKPRLGPALQRVVGTGLLWGLLAAIEAWLRLHHKAEDSNRDLLLSEAPLSLLDSGICWWVFVSLAHTMRTLQLRRNQIKLSLYRHFTNTLIFAVISSVIFMLYSIKSYRVLNCIIEWREVWMDEAYWHMLFACVLAVIMLLWRPTNNNQRYAFTPLLDNIEDDDEEEEQFVNDAYGVKMRGNSINADSSSGAERGEQQSDANTLDADLRWVEENIPTSTLPLLDSDEEIINTKFEVSKMQ
ncbi:lung seven transmembrane receptor domain-containing protein [Phthorimaea operculella]|nr:lung seven transmembrane receptor domain-containing protein [Phthorimaea operculella]